MNHRRSGRARARASALALLTAISLGTISRPIAAQTVVIRRADIERAGWNRVSEVLDGAAGWGRASVDGFTYAASPDRLPVTGESAPGMPEWIVVVDGQRVPTDLFGTHLLELLPISVGQIDSVVFTRGPGIERGKPVTRGVMSIFSRRSRQGLNGELTYQHGDESGDPGPFRYTALASPNVEKLGPFAHGDVGWAGRAWDVDAGIHLASLNVTDTLISSRFSPSAFAGVRQDIFAITPTVRAGVDGFGGRHEVMASYGDQRGLLFIPSDRAEQSLHVTSSYVGVGGSAVVGGGTALAYEGSSSVLDAGELASSLAFSVGHTRRHLGGSISASHALGPTTLTVGALADRWMLTTGALAGSQPSSGGGPFARARIPLGGAATVDGDATLVFDGAHSGALDASLAASLRLDSLTSIALRGSRVHAHPNMDGTWIDAFLLGYPLSVRAPTLAAVALSVDRHIGSRVGATVEVRGERVTDWSGLAPPAVSQSRTPLDSLTHTGNLLGARVRLETLRPSVWQGWIEYDRTTAVNLDDRAFGAEIASTPVDDLRAQLSASPVRDFRLSGLVNLTSGTRWTSFIGPAGSAIALPPVRRIDASMEKWMWRRRLRFELLYRNLLNETERYHPFGAQWNLRWHVSASLVL